MLPSETRPDACNLTLLSRKAKATACYSTRSIRTKRHLTSICNRSTSGHLQTRARHYALRRLLQDVTLSFRVPILLPKVGRHHVLTGTGLDQSFPRLALLQLRPP